MILGEAGVEPFARLARGALEAVLALAVRDSTPYG
jgi:hypothetical protein